MSDAVLVTGGAGFLGSHLVEALVARDHPVVVVDDLSTGARANLAGVADRVRVVEVDLRGVGLADLLAATPVSTVFHLAGHVGAGGSLTSPRADLEANALGTLGLLEALRDARPDARLVHVSSALVYGAARARPFREDDPTHVTSPYGVSKLAAEHYVRVFAHLYGLRAAILRPFSAYGPRQRKQVVYDLMRRIHDDPIEVVVHGDGTEERSFTHCSSIVDALLLVAERAPLDGEVYNVVDEEPVSIARLVELLGTFMEASPRVVFDGVARPGDVLRLDGDTTRLRAFGWEPRVALRDGLAETVDWFLTEARS